MYQGTAKTNVTMTDKAGIEVISHTCEQHVMCGPCFEGFSVTVRELKKIVQTPQE